MTPKQEHAALKVVIKRAIVVLDATGDAEMRFQNMGQVWNRAIGDAALAYGYGETRVRLVPTARQIAQADTVADWLAWLGHHHGGVPRLVAWAHDEPIWRMAERERCSQRTIHYRIDKSVALILGEFGGVEIDLDIVDEKPERAHPQAFIIEPSLVGPPLPVSQHGKCWIDGIGFMKNGKRWRNGHNKAARIAYAN
jgi:hypothetical protein